jgi:polyhydroxyalkanoate synthesis repressor PhaR
MANQAKDGDTVIIKKYANRRLYNTRTSSYITLDHLAQMVKENVEFKVIDAKSGADLTHSILTQIIMEEEAGGEQMLPTNFLRQLIAMYGNSMQALLPGYLEASMEHFRENQNKLRKAIEDRSAPIRWPRSPSATWKCSRLPLPPSCPALPGGQLRPRRGKVRVGRGRAFRTAQADGRNAEEARPARQVSRASAGLLSCRFTGAILRPFCRAGMIGALPNWLAPLIRQGMNQPKIKHALPVKRDEDFAQWYQAVIAEAELAEESGVRGCMVIKPWGTASGNASRS